MIIFLLASCRALTKRAGSGSVCQRYGSADPDQNVTDPEHYALQDVRFRKEG
jgi:hypothetical protein